MTRRTPRVRTSRRVVAGAALAVTALLTAAGVAVGGEPDQNGPNPDCTLLVPPNPLTAAGLGTPYRLVATHRRQGPCHETNADQAAFVQATILDPATGRLSVYDPLVIDEGTQPLVFPVPPRLPRNAVVGVWFGSNGDSLRLRSVRDSLDSGRCVNGLGRSIFGQFAFCNAPEFFAAARTAIAQGRLDVPERPEGTKSGDPCPTTRDFGLVDQDQSDNVTTSYLIVGGTTVQNTAANQAALADRNPSVLFNGSDNALLTNFENAALGCPSFTAPDLADEGRAATSLALNELAADAQQTDPVALVPLNDPMTLVRGRSNVNKTNLFRLGVNQPEVDPATETPQAYCQNMITIGSQRIQQERPLTEPAASPTPDEANNLFTFLASRLHGSFEDLGCGDLLGVANPVQLVTDGTGVVIDATFGGAGGGAGSTAPTATATATPTVTPPVTPPASSTATIAATTTATATVTATTAAKPKPAAPRASTPAPAGAGAAAGAKTGGRDGATAAAGTTTGQGGPGSGGASGGAMQAEPAAAGTTAASPLVTLPIVPVEGTPVFQTQGQEWDRLYYLFIALLLLLVASSILVRWCVGSTRRGGGGGGHHRRQRGSHRSAW